MVNDNSRKLHSASFGESLETCLLRHTLLHIRGVRLKMLGGDAANPLSCDFAYGTNLMLGVCPMFTSDDGVGMFAPGSRLLTTCA